MSSVNVIRPDVHNQVRETAISHLMLRPYYTAFSEVKKLSQFGNSRSLTALKKNRNVSG